MRFDCADTYAKLVSYLFACIAVSYECESFLLAWT